MKGLSKGRYDKTFAGEDGEFGTYRIIEQQMLRRACANAQTRQSYMYDIGCRLC